MTEFASSHPVEAHVALDAHTTGSGKPRVVAECDRGKESNEDGENEKKRRQHDTLAVFFVRYTGCQQGMLHVLFAHIDTRKEQVDHQ